MHFASDIICNAESMASDIISEVMAINQLWGMDVTAFWTGTPTGELLLQVTAYPGAQKGAVVAPADLPEEAWSTVDGAEVELLAGEVVDGRPGEKSFTWLDTATNHRWARIVYRRTSGTGNLTVYFNAKVP